MNRLRSAMHSRGRLAALLLACALALKLLVPPGYMPVPGQVAVSLCTGYGVQTVLLDASGKPVPADDERAEAATACGFASLAAPILPASDPMPALSAMAMVATAATLLVLPLLIRRTTPRPPGRAPPATR